MFGQWKDQEINLYLWLMLWMYGLFLTCVKRKEKRGRRMSDLWRPVLSYNF